MRIVLCEVAWPGKHPRDVKISTACVCVLEKRQRGSVYELALVLVCVCCIFVLSCEHALRIVSGEWIVAHLFTQTNKSQAAEAAVSHNCIGTILGTHTPVCSVHILTLVSSNITHTHSTHVLLMSPRLNSWIFPPPALFTERILDATFPCASGVCTYYILQIKHS